MKPPEAPASAAAEKTVPEAADISRLGSNEPPSSEPVASERDCVASASMEPASIEPASMQPASMQHFLSGISARAFRFAELGLRQREDALDAVQDAMMRMLGYRDRPAAEWTPLFWSILRRRIVDLHGGDLVEALDLDSMAMIDVALEVERRLGVHVPDEDLERLTSIDAIAEYLSGLDDR